MHLKVAAVRVSSLHTDEKMIRLWSDPTDLLPLKDGRPQSFEDIFRWASKKGAWHTDVERYRQDNGAVLEEEEDLFVDMWRHVWVPAVEKWDQGKLASEQRDPTDPKHAQAFFRWVMYLMGHYLTDLKRIHMTQKEKLRRDAEPLEVPASDDPWQAAWGEGVLEEQYGLDIGIDEIGKVVTKIEDREWLSGALGKIKDERVKGAVAVLVKYYGKESTENMQERLRQTTNMTFPKIKRMVAGDLAVRELVKDGLARLPDEVKKPRRSSCRKVGVISN